jgi:hypothetical protein
MSEPLGNYGAVTPWSDMPAGVRVSAIFLVLLACALGLCGVLCLVAVVTLLVHHGRGLAGLPLGLVGVVGLVTSLVCFRAADALRSGRRWGANVATACGGLAVAFGGLLVFDLFHPGRQAADEYFLYPVAPIFLLLGAWLCIYLNLPRVRSSFERRPLR